MSKAIRASDLPISVHTSVLGVDIVVYQQAIREEVHEGGYKGGLKPDIEVRAWAGEATTPWIRKDLAAWARRNLFDGARPQRR